MSLKDILVFLDVSPGSEGRLRLATRVAREHGASLSAVFAYDNREAAFPPGLGVARRGLITQLIPTMADITESAMSVDIAEQQFRECLHSLGGEGDWHQLDRADDSEVIAIARTADLIVIGQINPNSRAAATWRPQDVVAACGRPVLMVPYVGTFLQVGRRVLVAWDGSRDAVRALNDALPVIATAEQVIVMTIHARDKDVERDRSATKGIIRHLARHGIVAHVDQRLRSDTAVSDWLLSRAMDFYVDLIVAGACRHSPLRDAVIGGVSRDLFQRMTVPVLMSH
jgi:nucleotide-binding universal stress UspA family protein